MAPRWWQGVMWILLITAGSIASRRLHEESGEGRGQRVRRTVSSLETRTRRRGAADLDRFLSSSAAAERQRERAAPKFNKFDDQNSISNL